MSRMVLPVFDHREWNTGRIGEQLASEGIAWISRPTYDLHLPNGQVIPYIRQWPNRYVGPDCDWVDINRPIATRDP